MTITDIDASKAETRRDDCLHCVVATAIEEFFERHGERRDGQVVIDVMTVCSKLAECTAEVINLLSDRSQRRRAMRFAHDALDASMKSQRTGRLVSVDVPVEQ
jgi:hypothetical protein